MQLGHKTGKTCWNKGWVGGDDFVVLDVNGIHEVGVNFCDCKKSKPEFIQLLCFGWFPASVDRLETVVTFSVLKHVRKTLKLNSLLFFIYFHPREPKCDSKCSQTNHGNNISHACKYSIVYTPVCMCPQSTIKYSKIYIT